MTPTTHKKAVFILWAALLGIVCGTGSAGGSGEPSPADRWLRQALATDPAASQQAVSALRQIGAPAVERLLASRPTGDRAAEQAWHRALDAVCGQLGCVHSRLFWYQDFDLAVREAQRSQRPILSLRLLGRLDEALSCANSRFFRSILYADPMLSDFLRRRFVLHWSTERPVPTFHIDFGGGRSLEGTITGNSIHYVLDPQGRLVDGLPGLYGPGLLRQRLWAAAALADELAPLDDSAFVQERAMAHRQRLALLASQVSPVRLDVGVVEEIHGADASAGPGATMAPELSELTARLAGERALTKAFVEAPVVEAISLGSGNVDPNRPLWGILAQHHWRDLQLSETSLELLRHHLEGFDETVTEATLATIQRSIAVDCMRNEYELHVILHRWLASTEAPQLHMDAFNARVYDELFLTPADDPWLGLASVETYLAISGLAAAERMD